MAKEYSEMNIKASRWVKGNFDRVYFNHVMLEGTDIKVFAYADKDGKAKVAVKAGYMINQYAREVVEAIKGHIEGVVDRAAGCVRSMTYAELVAEIA